MVDSEGPKKSLEIVGEEAAGEPEYEARGVQNPRIVDLIGLDHELGEVMLSILEGRPWESADPDAVKNQLQQLEDKLNSYFDYVLDGHLGQQYPDYAGLPVGIRLDCADEPGEPQAPFLEAAGRFAASRGIRFVVRAVGDPFARSAAWETNR
ncbi:MAG: DUF6572 domain-containing protein [Acidobacteriota bacterium]